MKSHSLQLIGRWALCGTVEAGLRVSRGIQQKDPAFTDSRKLLTHTNSGTFIANKY